MALEPKLRQILADKNDIHAAMVEVGMEDPGDDFDSYAATIRSYGVIPPASETETPLEYYRRTRPTEWLSVRLPSEMEEEDGDQWEQIEILFQFDHSDIPDGNIFRYGFGITTSTSTASNRSTTIDWGDGTVLSNSTATSWTHDYVWSNLTNELSNGKRQCLLKIKTKRSVCTAIDLYKSVYRYDDAGVLVSGLRYDMPIYEISINARHITTLTAAGTTYRNYNVRYFSINTSAISFAYLCAWCVDLVCLPESVFTGAITTPTYAFYYCTSLLWTPKDMNITKATTVAGMFGYDYCIRSCDAFNSIDSTTIKSTNQLFIYCKNLRSFGSIHLTSATSISYTFAYCNRLLRIGEITVDTASCDTSYLCPQDFLLRKIKLNAVSSNPSYMFSWCTSLFDLSGELSLLSTNTTVSHMFEYCYTLQTIPWAIDMTPIKTGYYFLLNCYALKDVTLNGTTAALTDARSIFSGCRSIEEFDGTLQLDLSAVTSSYGSDIFSNCWSLKTLPPLLNTDKWNSTTVTNMFNACHNLEYIDYNFVFPKATSVANFCANCWNLKRIGSINAPLATTVSGMFTYCYKIKEIGNITVGKLTTWENFFSYALSLETLPSITAGTGTWAMTTQATALQYMPMLKNLNGFVLRANNYNLADSVMLTHDTLVDMLNSLPTLTTKRTLTLGTQLKAKLSTDEIAIATTKLWTVA